MKSTRRFFDDVYEETIGNPEIRERVFGEIENPIKLMNSKTVISKNASIEKECITEVNTTINNGKMKSLSRSFG